MPKSTVNSKKRYREFSKLHERYVGNNYCKNLRLAFEAMSLRHGLTKGEVEFLLFIYDLEFFTLSYIGNHYGIKPNKAGQRFIYPMMKLGHIYKHFDKLSVPEDQVDQMMRSETKYTYRVRYALSQGGRLLVQRFYRLLENPKSTF